MRAATIEEIEAEKTLIEKDVVSSYFHFCGDLLCIILKQADAKK